MTDAWGSVGVEGKVDGLITPATRWVQVSPNDSSDLPERPRAIASLEVGVIACVDETGNVAAWPFAAGDIKPLRPVRINATGTTSTKIYALY